MRSANIGWSKLFRSAVAQSPARYSRGGIPHLVRQALESRLLQISDSLPNPDKTACGLTSPSPLGPQHETECERPITGSWRRHNVAACQQAYRTRHRYVRYHWRQAKRLSSTLSEHTTPEWASSVGSGKSPLHRLQQFIQIRYGFIQSYNAKGALMADALIWREIMTLKCLNSTDN